MQANVGKLDRAVRIVVGAVLIAWGLYAQNWWGLLGVPLLISGFVGVCPLYKLVGINTCRTQ